MNPLIAIAAGLFPEILKIIAGDKAGTIGTAVAKAVTEATGANTPEAAKTKVEVDPKVAADLQVKLAQIALDARKAEADAAEKERQAALAAQKQLAEQEAKQRADELEAGKQALESTSGARTALQELAKLNQPMAWTPSIISYIVVCGFLLVVLFLMTGIVVPPATDNTGKVSVIQILNICIGALAAGFATVLNFWLGSSLGSKNKDQALVQSSAVSQVKDMMRESAADAVQKKKITDESEKPEPISQSLGPTKSIVGKMSTFGGPTDTGMAPDEGLALFERSDLPAHKDIFLDEQPSGTTGLGRRLNPQSYYLACRWDYQETPRGHLRSIKARVSNPRNGKSGMAQPVDWGPNERTGRDADLSPGLASFLGLETDQVCQVNIPLPASVLRPELPESGQLTVLSLAQIKAAFHDFQYEEAGGGAIKILGNWVAENITTVIVPQIARLQPGPVECHKAIKQPLLDAFAEVERRNFLDRILKWDGLFVPRHKSWNPNRTLSSHSWGIAFDINARWNGYGSEPAPKGSTGSVVELIPIFESFGFAWGGYFSKRYRDGMHFEYCKVA